MDMLKEIMEMEEIYDSHYTQTWGRAEDYGSPGTKIKVPDMFPADELQLQTGRSLPRGDDIPDVLLQLQD